MLTTLQFVDKVYLLLKAADFSDLYKDEKPIDEAMDHYIVINALTVNTAILQECPINVNVHYKDADAVRRIAARASMITEALDIANELDNYCDSEVDIEMLFQTEIRVEDKPEHYMNLRFAVRHVQS